MKKLKIAILVLIAFVLLLTTSLFVVAESKERSVGQLLAGFFKKSDEVIIEVGNRKVYLSSIKSMKVMYPEISDDEIVESFTKRAMLMNEAERLGIEVDDETVAKNLKSSLDGFLAFGEDHPDAKILYDYLDELGMTVEEYFALDEMFEATRILYIENKMSSIILEESGITNSSYTKADYDAAFESYFANVKENTKITVYYEKLKDS